MASLPNLYIVPGKRIIDLSGLSGEDHVYSLAAVELAGYKAEEPIIVIGTGRNG